MEKVITAGKSHVYKTKTVSWLQSSWYDQYKYDIDKKLVFGMKNGIPWYTFC